MDQVSAKIEGSQKRQTTPEEAFKHMFEGVHFQFPTFKHDRHPAVVDINQIADERLSVGDRVADAVASGVGSWPFIITQSVLLALWLVLNSVAWIQHWDPYPFILLNLALSFQAAYAAPFVMMSQNRQATKDRLTAENDYKTDTKGEEEIRHIMEHLDHQDQIILQIVERLEAQTLRMAQQEQLTLQIVQRLESQNQRMETQHQEILGWLSHVNPDLAMRAVQDASLKGEDGEQ